ncbi:MAG TPA: SIMPL domain-containing protein [Candidatus Kapabacteria bacterium]|nr:SIMPL domain-containing protein [Candidatus Kapabacteria bacterium]
MKIRTIIFALAVAAVPLVASAQRTVTVIGSASVESRPDYALVTMMISAQDQTAQGVFSRSDENGRSLVRAITASGVAVSDIEQQGTALNPSYDYSAGGGGAAPHLAGYRLMTTYDIKVRSLSDVPKVIDAGTLAGASNVSISAYGISKKGDLEDQAEAKALSDAREKAEHLAEQMGGKLGEIVTITDGDLGASPAAGLGREEEEERRGMIVSGNNAQKIKRSASLKVTFSIK